jgi:hypothetical protein
MLSPFFYPNAQFYMVVQLIVLALAVLLWMMVMSAPVV